MELESEKKLLLIGGGGHCRSVLDTVLRCSTYKEVGIIEKNTVLNDYSLPVIGTDDDLPALLRCGWTDAFITVGSVGDTTLRQRLYLMVLELGFVVPAIIDPSAVLASDAQLAKGVFIGKRAVVNSGSVIEECAIINTSAIIDHDCSIGAFSHISPGAVLCGQVTVGKYSHVGAGSVIRQGITVGHDSTIGIGSVIVKDIPDNVVAYGNPCKVMRRSMA